MPWQAVTAIAAVVSTVAYVVTALYIRAELKALDKDRYLSITNQIFAIWESKEFMEAQLWLLYRLEQTTWQAFIQSHRGNEGEAAFHRVGAFYNHLGSLARLGLIKEEEILTTVGAFAIAVWQKIEPLVREARRIEHSTLFVDFERLLPSCFECYLPALGDKTQVSPFSLPRPDGKADPGPPRITVSDLKKRLDRGDPVTLVDVRPSAQQERDPRVLPGATLLPAEQVGQRYTELPAGRELILYCA